MGGEGGDAAIEVAAEAGAGLEAVNLREDVRAVDERLCVGGDEAGESDEDAVDFGLLFFEEADELVVLLDGFERLDVDGLAGGTCTVDDAGDAAL